MAGSDREKSNGVAASFLNCPRCGLTIKARAPWLAIRYCPRCLARGQTIVELLHSRRGAAGLQADGPVRRERSGGVRSGGWATASGSPPVST